MKCLCAMLQETRVFQGREEVHERDQTQSKERLRMPILVHGILEGTGRHWPL